MGRIHYFSVVIRSGELSVHEFVQRINGPHLKKIIAWLWRTEGKKEHNLRWKARNAEERLEGEKAVLCIVNPQAI